MKSKRYGIAAEPFGLRDVAKMLRRREKALLLLLLPPKMMSPRLLTLLNGCLMVRKRKPNNLQQHKIDKIIPKASTSKV